MTLPPAPPLAIRDVLALLVALGDVVERVVLVGGQAVNFWVEHYLHQNRVPELLLDAPFTSKDVDFCAPREVVPIVAARLRRGEAFLPTLDDATPNVGVVRFDDSSGRRYTIDFLGAPFGMAVNNVLTESVPVALDDLTGAPTGHRLRVMHPVACMESRVHNVIGLAPAYDTPHGRKQLRAAVSCAREALKDILDTPASPSFDPVRAVLDLNERVFKFCLHDSHGRVVAQRTGIDPSNAILDDLRLGEKFIRIRLPQMRARLALLRARLPGR